MAATRPSPDAHLTSGEVAMYVDARLPDAERLAVDTHLAECEICRGEVLEVRSMLRTAPRRTNRHWRTFALVGAAAAALVLVATPWRGGRPTLGDSDAATTTERAVLPDGAPDSVQIVAPSLAAVVSRDALTFSWRRGAGDARFTVTLMNERGDVAWTATTRDTVIVPPKSVAIVPGTTYILYVDALRVDGTSSRSDARSFTVDR